MGITYAADEFGFERMYVWYVAGTLEKYNHAIRHAEQIEHDGTVFHRSPQYKYKKATEYIFYYLREDGLIQVNLPAEFGTLEKALPFLELEKITP